MDSEGLRRSRTLLRNVLSLAGRAKHGLAASLLFAAGPAAAQTATACATTSCELAQQTALTTLLQPLTTLPGSAAWTANYDTQQSIYLNSTYARRVQSAQNSVLANAQNLIWLSNNNPSPFAANVRAALSNAGVMTEFGSACGQTSR